MRFTVTWSTEATDRMMALWLARPSGERAAFSERVDWLDRALRENAHQKGAAVSQEPHLRVLTPPEFFEPPTIGIGYSVSVDDRKVEVMEIILVERKPQSKSDEQT